MKATRILGSWVLGLALLLVTGSCVSEPTPTGVADPVGPDSRLWAPLQPLGLLECDPMPVATASATIGPVGGVLEVGPHTLRIPPAALGEAVTITAQTAAGSVRAVEFQPHGLKFAVPGTLTLSYDGCKIGNRKLPKRIAYVSSGFDILAYLASFDDLRAKEVTGELEHFSQYAVAW